MHIVYVIAPGGGPEAYVRSLAPELHKRGHSVSVVCTVPATRIKVPFPDSVRVLFAPTSPMHYYAALIVDGFRALALRLRAWEEALAVSRALSVIERAEPISLVEVTEGLPISSIRQRWTVIVRAHGSAPTFRHFCQDGDVRRDRWLVEMEVQQLRQAKAIGALSQHLAEHLVEFYRAPRERVRVVPYPIDVQRFRPNGHWGGKGGAVRLLTIGRLERRKGVDTLLRSLSPKIWQHFPDTTVYLLGSESDLKKADLLRLVPPDKRDQIIFPGFVDHRLLPQYYDQSTVYVAPTRYETFGYTVLEAMACGKPVVATRVGAIPELVEDGTTGVLVPPDDPYALAQAIDRLLTDGGRRKWMGERARTRAISEFNAEKILEKTLDFYNLSLSS